MRRAEITFAVLLALGAGVMLREALRLPVAWTGIGPGSGFFPFWLSLLAGFQAVVLVIRSVRAPVPPGRAAPLIERDAVRPLLIVFLPMVAVVALLDVLGIYLGGALYLAGYMTFVGRHRWVSVLLVSVLLPTALFLIFERWFLLPMPKGMLLERLLYGR